MTRPLAAPLLVGLLLVVGAASAAPVGIDRERARAHLEQAAGKIDQVWSELDDPHPDVAALKRELQEARRRLEALRDLLDQAPRCGRR